MAACCGGRAPAAARRACSLRSSKAGDGAILRRRHANRLRLRCGAAQLQGL